MLTGIVLCLSLFAVQAQTAVTPARTPAVQTADLKALVAQTPKLPLEATELKAIPPTEGWAMGMVSWVASDGKGLTHLIQRGDKADPIVVLDREGKYLGEWTTFGKMFSMKLMGGSIYLASQQKSELNLWPGCTMSSAVPPAPNDTHRFWDTRNIALFSGVAGSRAMDYASTRHFRDRGANEWLLTNKIVDNKPLFATIEVAATAASLGVSYLLHKTNHHTLERWVSVLHIGITVAGAANNYTLGGPRLLTAVK